MNPDRLAELEDERRFLLRSLRDLDAEHAVGDVDEADFATLRDGYTKRAAAVLRQIEDGKAALPRRRPVRWRRRIAVAAGVIAVAAGSGVLVARSQGERTAGGGPTGNAGIEDTASLLAQARGVLFVDARAAQDLYQQVLDKDPDNPEALTYQGWLLFLASRGASADLAADAVDSAKQQLTRAVAADATYADPHCFLAVIAKNADEDLVTARTEVDQCLALDPPADIRRDIIEPFAASLPPSATTPATTTG